APLPSAGGAAAPTTPPTPEGPPADARALADDAAGATPAPEFVDPAFGPRYVIEEIVIRGNLRTKESLIRNELGLQPGDAVLASDARVEAARFRLLSLGHFVDARLSVQRGRRRGGVVLVVEVEERGALVINELYPSTSAATAFWGGADVSDTNFLGRGINLGGGVVASTKPIVLNAERGLGLRLHGTIPERQGPGGVGLSATALYNDGSEFYRVTGDDDDADPGRFTAVNTRRVGGVVGASRALTRALRAGLDVRGESVDARLPPQRVRTFPDGTTAPIDFDVRDGASRVATAAVTLDYDTRSDPVLPRSGARVVGTVEAGVPAVSSYTYGKALVQASLYAKMPRGHALGVHLLGGAIVGDAPYFDRFFVGDLNLLLPRRALGMSFSTLPSRNLLGTSIAGHRYDDYAARALVEYAIPVWRRKGVVYGGDFFAAVGLLGMASDGDLSPPGGLTWSKLPVDLTGDVGLRLDTYVGIFTVSIANALSRSSF
ncbi:MAG TPA: POTRA domain-containing protein, partial [Polyangia bacterium]|nr:POTRA domain-containing protein [Polyangia bacterium]